MNMNDINTGELRLTQQAIQTGLDNQPDHRMAVSTTMLRHDVGLQQIGKEVWKAASRMPVKGWRLAGGWRYVRTA